MEAPHGYAPALARLLHRAARWRSAGALLGATRVGAVLDLFSVPGGPLQPCLPEVPPGLRGGAGARRDRRVDGAHPNRLAIDR